MPIAKIIMKISSNNNIKTPKNKQEQLQIELKVARDQWRQDKELLEQEKKKMGYEHVSFEKILNHSFIEEQMSKKMDDALISALIAIQDQHKALLGQYQELWPEECVAKKLNKKHAIVHSGQTYVLTEKRHQVFGGKDFTLESRQSFRMFYEDERIQWHNKKMIPIADIWLKSPLKRKYYDIVFDPTMNSEKAERLDLYNMWRGFAKEPEQGECPKYWDHVEQNICLGDEKTYKYVRKWMAYVFQHPDEVHTALVLCGSQGVGKNSFVEPLGTLLGSHYVLLSNISELISNFNFHLKNAVLIHANEAFWGGNKKDVGTLKAMITEKTRLIEGKGKDRIMVRNYKHVILSSNEDWPVHLDPDDRRFLVLKVGEKHKEDIPYFKAIQQELDDGGYEALLYDLLNEDLNDFNPRKLPSSPYAFDIKIRCANSIQKYVYEFLLEDRLSIDKGGAF